LGEYIPLNEEQLICLKKGGRPQWIIPTQKYNSMLPPIEELIPNHPDWQQLCQQLQQSSTLAAIVLSAWQMGIWLAQSIVTQQLQERAQQPTVWGVCPTCQARLVSKGFARRELLTLVGMVHWQRRVGRCPHRCPGSQSIPFDQALEIAPYQQTSLEVVRLACLLSVFLPFELSGQILEQLSGIQVCPQAIWLWVQSLGRRQIAQQQAQLETFKAQGEVEREVIDGEQAALPLVIAADGVTVPFRPQVGTAKGKRVFQEVKIAVLSRLQTQAKGTGRTVTRLVHRRVVAVLGEIGIFQSHLCLEAARQNIEDAAQVVWLSDGAKGFWALFEACFASVAVGILDFYHAAQHLWQAAQAYQDGNPARSASQWFERMRHQLRHGYVHRVLKELKWLSSQQSTASEASKQELTKVYHYLNDHWEHVQYHQFKQMGLPIGSGMVESACKWLITQRFKGTGMIWSEAGFKALLALRVAWVNQRFDPLFSQQPLSPSLYSPNR
jgi:hypothetical protein